MVTHEPVQPAGWKPPKGYSNGVLVTGAGRRLYVAGQVAWDANQQLVGAGDFTAQFRQALDNVMAVVEAAGGEARHVASLTLYVLDKRAYLAATRELGEIYRARMGRHFPAIALVQVADLLEDGALVEIQATAELD